ncbi:GreA/GreB family elongation factor [Zhongshania sp. BJYM1]|uniref:GreA/GreB family elongation factor n=1 Tax=Zhongshania aquatica TaxID=2965069 RepID=UPI0022B58A7A|nr:GreA/GreB family elongation factor [Marortus sp. BJYM1]
MNTEIFVEVRRFISWLKDDYSKMVEFRPITLRPIELASLLDKLEGIYDVPVKRASSFTVLIGAKVGLMNMNDFTEASIVISLPSESNPAEGKISVLSPLGSTLIGRNRGEVIKLCLGNSENMFCIISVVQNP